MGKDFLQSGALGRGGGEHAGDEGSGLWGRGGWVGGQENRVTVWEGGWVVWVGWDGGGGGGLNELLYVEERWMELNDE